ncbi:MAG: transporter [Acidobacteria bacterium]|nr:transporter [Acidobacteriota bacterium]
MMAESGLSRRPRYHVPLPAVAALVLSGFSVNVAAQDLTPRAYWPAPDGTKVAIVGYSHVRGDVFFDPSIPLSGVDSKIHTGLAAYLQTFSLWGRTATIVIDLPYSRGTTQGLIEDEPARRDFSGLGDLGASLSVNLLGAPAMTPADFQALRAEPHPIVGASLKVIAPTGRYDDNRLINVGSNRWAAKLDLGSIVPLHRKWLLELDAGVWWFGDNDDFLTGRREQEPIYNFQVHLIHRFSPGFWVSLDANYFVGGRQTIGGDELGDVLHNARLGGMVVVPFRGRHAVKIGYFAGVRTESGSDFDQLLMSYQVLLR